MRPKALINTSKRSWISSICLAFSEKEKEGVIIFYKSINK